VVGEGALVGGGRPRGGCVPKPRVLLFSGGEGNCSQASSLRDRGRDRASKVCVAQCQCQRRECARRALAVVVQVQKPARSGGPDTVHALAVVVQKPARSGGPDTVHGMGGRTAWAGARRGRAGSSGSQALACARRAGSCKGSSAASSSGRCARSVLELHGVSQAVRRGRVHGVGGRTAWAGARRGRAGSCGSQALACARRAGSCKGSSTKLLKCARSV